MFQTLLESGPRGVDRRRRWTLASAALHAASVTVVAVLTLPNEQASLPERIVDVWPWVPPTHAPEPPERQTRNAGSRSSAPITPISPTIRVPTVPSFDPSVDFDRRSLAPNEVFVEGPALAILPHHVPGDVLDANHVDRQVMARSGNGQPSYPESLRAASLEGEVVARFVVDTLGQVEPSSVTVVAATHPLFAQSVVKWLARTRYVPAEYAGHTVRQLVEQKFQFALRR